MILHYIKITDLLISILLLIVDRYIHGQLINPQHHTPQRKPVTQPENSPALFDDQLWIILGNERKHCTSMIFVMVDSLHIEFSYIIHRLYDRLVLLTAFRFVIIAGTLYI